MTLMTQMAAFAALPPWNRQRRYLCHLCYLRMIRFHSIERGSFRNTGLAGVFDPMAQVQRLIWTSKW